MLSASDTAYPLLKASLSVQELEELFTPNVFELVFAESQTSQPASLVGLLLLLKTFQRLGYFVKVADVSSSIVHQVTRATGLREIPRGIATYDSSRTRRRHEAVVRSYLGVAAFDRQAKRAMLKACLEASRVREDLADIVNVAIEELVRQRYELPGFTTLFRGARSARATVNRGYYAQISASVDDATKGRFEWLLELQGQAEERRSGWDDLKQEPGQPTVKQIQQFLDHLII